MTMLASAEASVMALRELVERASTRARLDSKPLIVSFTVAADEPVDPVAIFAIGAERGGYRAYWEQPATGELLVGIGECEAISLDGDKRFAKTARIIRESRNHMLVERPIGLPGGPIRFAAFAFDSNRDPEGAWRDIPAGRLILPRLLVAARDGRCGFTVNFSIDPDTDVPDAVGRAVVDLERLRGARNRGDEIDRIDICNRIERPGADAWRSAVADSVAAIRQGALEKVVLARSLQLDAANEFSPESALKRLRAGGPAATVFAVANGPRCFLGATPERLVRLRDGIVSVDCLAGSIARGDTPADDARLARQLLASDKDRGEHDVVVRIVENALADVCDGLHRPDGTPHIRLSRNVQHLSTPLTGRLRDGFCVMNLVERLHPTPAVGGFPLQPALDVIAQREGFDRGWYAGPVGWVDGEGEGEFAVALRSALLNGSSATLYAGAGIVADSDPVAEYAETALKMLPMLAALGVDA